MSDTLEVVVRVEDTQASQAVARTVARHTRAGDVVVLGGDLGAGKTTFTKAFGAELGVTDVINSPTFALAQVYEGTNLRLHHLDVYRLENLEETLDLALPELTDSNDVVVIEWGDTITRVLENNYLYISFEYPEPDTEPVPAEGAQPAAAAEAGDAAGEEGSEDAGDSRILCITAVGQIWQDRIVHLRDDLEEVREVAPC